LLPRRRCRRRFLAGCLRDQRSHAALWGAKAAILTTGISADLADLGGGQATKVLVSGSAPFISISGLRRSRAAQGADVTMLSCAHLSSLMSRPDIDKPEMLRAKVGVSHWRGD
jgi:hypothetical protein